MFEDTVGRSCGYRTIEAVQCRFEEKVGNGKSGVLTSVQLDSIDSFSNIWYIDDITCSNITNNYPSRTSIKDTRLSCHAFRYHRLK